MSNICPESGVLAAYAEERLSEAEATSLLDHAADCVECRRELALLTQAVGRESDSVLPGSALLQEIVLQAVDRQRTTRRSHAPRTSPLPQLLGYAAAALIAALATAVWFNMRPLAPSPQAKAPTVESPRPDPAIAPVPQPAPSYRLPAPPEDREDPPMDEEPAPAPEDPAPPADPAPRDENPAPPAVPAGPSRPAVATMARTYTPVTLTDFNGELSVKRRGSRSKERVSGVVSVGDGDLLMADKAAAFFLLGHYAIALVPQTQVTVARVQEDEAPSLVVHTGEAMIDSGSAVGSRWLVGNGSVTLSIDKTRGQFAVTADEKGMILSALSGTLAGRDESGRTFDLAQGDRLAVSADKWDRRADASAAAKKRALLGASRPKERTLLHVPFDGTSLKAISITTGDVIKERTPRGQNEFLRSVDKKDTHVGSVRFAEGIKYGRELTLRVRIRTNLSTVRLGLGIEEKGTLFNELKVERKLLGTWMTLEMSLDEGFLDRPFLITLSDRMVNLTVSGRQQDVFGDVRGYIFVDDVQIFEPNP